MSPADFFQYEGGHLDGQELRPAYPDRSPPGTIVYNDRSRYLFVETFTRGDGARVAKYRYAGKVPRSGEA